MLWNRYWGLEDFSKEQWKEKYAKSFFSGSISLFTAWLVCFPLDVVKTNIQAVNLMHYSEKASSKHLKSVLYQVLSRYRTLGYRGFYSGLTIALYRTIPTGGMSFLVYEISKESMTSQ